MRPLLILLFVSLSLVGRGDAQPCEDRSPCTVEDKCVEGQCRGISVVCEDDGNACTIEYCSHFHRGCVSDPIRCAGPCVTGECDPAFGCIPRPDGVPCDDGSTCTVNDRCLGGFCRGERMPNGTPCRDALGPCTVGDHCQRGQCVGELRECPEADGNLCTREACEFLTGACISLPPRDCDGPCETGRCEPATGRCPSIADGTPCSDDNECTLDDVCFAGICRGATVGSPTVSGTATPARSPTATPSIAMPSPSPVKTASPTLTARVRRNPSGGCAIEPASHSLWSLLFLILAAVTRATRTGSRNHASIEPKFEP